MRSAFAIALVSCLAACATQQRVPLKIGLQDERLSDLLVQQQLKPVVRTPPDTVQDDRAIRCFANAIVADIPEDQAAEIADMLELKLTLDPVLTDKWLTFNTTLDPRRHDQIAAREHRFCPDIAY
jgi:hypothetical protein